MILLPAFCIFEDISNIEQCINFFFPINRMTLMNVLDTEDSTDVSFCDGAISLFMICGEFY